MNGNSEADRTRLRELLEELRCYTDRAAEPDDDPGAGSPEEGYEVTEAVREDTRRAEALINEVQEKAPSERRREVALLAGVLPLVHRCSKPDELLTDITSKTEASLALIRAGDGSGNRRDLLGGLQEPLRSTYFWLGHCAYSTPDPELVLIWSAAAEEAGPAGAGAPWDTAGLTTQRTLGRNLDDLQGAVETVRRYSLPIQGARPPLHRRYLAAVLDCSFESAKDYWQGRPPTRWYPGWLMPPPRRSGGGAREEPAHHTFEVRRGGDVSLFRGLLAVVATTGVLAKNTRRTRTLERWAREHSVWERGRELHAVDRSRGGSTARTAGRLVADYLREVAP